MQPEEIYLVLCNCPDADSAGKISRTLIEEGLAACVSIMPGCHSIYRWQGSIEQAEEIPLVIKTTASGYAAIETRISELHPYDLPEIVAVALAQGLPEYLTWVGQETEIGDSEQ